MRSFWPIEGQNPLYTHAALSDAANALPGGYKYPWPGEDGRDICSGRCYESVLGGAYPVVYALLRQGVRYVTAH